MQPGARISALPAPGKPGWLLEAASKCLGRVVCGQAAVELTLAPRDDPGASWRGLGVRLFWRWLGRRGNFPNLPWGGGGCLGGLPMSYRPNIIQ